MAFFGMSIDGRSTRTGMLLGVAERSMTPPRIGIGEGASHSSSSNDTLGAGRSVGRVSRVTSSGSASSSSSSPPGIGRANPSSSDRSGSETDSRPAASSSSHVGGSSWTEKIF